MTCGQGADAELILLLLLTLILIRYNVATSGPSTRDESGSASCLTDSHRTHPSTGLLSSICFHVLNILASGLLTHIVAIHPGPTSWHTVFAFNENAHPSLTRVGKGWVVA